MDRRKLEEGNQILWRAKARSKTSRVYWCRHVFQKRPRLQLWRFGPVEKSQNERGSPSMGDER